MHFAQKIRRLWADQSLAALAREVGIAPSNLNKILSGSQTRFSTGLKLARVLGVPVDWLGDDDQDWPPPESDTGRASRLVEEALASKGLAGHLTRDESDLLSAFRSMPPDQQQKALYFVLGLSVSGSESSARKVAGLAEYVEQDRQKRSREQPHDEDTPHKPEDRQ